ncbi:TonB-dependent receptor plug domain-containing protein [Massilia sp. B-10]|nr:TonB-dependent receptor plug domain-containing protein [Massilia sp. B-10]
MTQSLIALAALGSPLAAQAQEAPKEATLQELRVTAAPDVPYKATKVSSPKITQPLVDTTQTISVIKKELIAEQGASSIVEALRNTPGITMQLGENGNTSAMDTIQMRGFATQSSIFVDGVRDLGAVTRDAFNIEQIEVAKGPARRRHRPRRRFRLHQPGVQERAGRQFHPRHRQHQQRQQQAPERRHQPRPEPDQRLPHQCAGPGRRRDGPRRGRKPQHRRRAIVRVRPGNPDPHHGPVAAYAQRQYARRRHSEHRHRLLLL